MDKYQEIEYRNNLARMNLKKLEAIAAKKHRTKQDADEAYKCAVNLNYHELCMQVYLNNPVYRDKTDKELYKMAENDLKTFAINKKADIPMIHLMQFVKNVFKKKDINGRKKYLYR